LYIFPTWQTGFLPAAASVPMGRFMDIRPLTRLIIFTIRISEQPTIAGTV
jgi:hypothetical protein